MAKDKEKKKKKGSVIDRINERLKRAKDSKKFENIILIRAGNKPKRIRFITDMEEAEEIIMHDNWDTMWPTPCLTYFGKECPYCDNQDYKTYEQYAWTVRDLDQKKNFIFSHRPEGRSPIPAMVMRYQKYGTLCDRAYEISVTGERQDKTWDLVPDGGPVEWKKSFKPFTREEILNSLLKAGGMKNGEELGKARGGDDDDDEDDDE